jgi:hypothetical protein
LKTTDESKPRDRQIIWFSATEGVMARGTQKHDPTAASLKQIAAKESDPY